MIKEKKASQGLTLKHKIGYGLGDAGGCMSFAIMGSTFAMYCTDALKVNTEETDYRISDEMVAYLCNFVKFGNPNGDNLPEWNKCKKDKDVLSFGNDISSKGKIKMLIYNTLTNKPVGE